MPAALRALLGALAVTFVMATPAAAATYSVTETGDAGDGTCDTSCTLRDAIDDANGAAGNEVLVPAGTYTLTQGELVTTQPMQITGAGTRQTILSGGDASRVLRINSTGATTLRDLTVRDGLADATDTVLPGDGGGILVGIGSATVGLVRVHLRDNVATMGGGGLALPPEAGGSGGGAVAVTQSTISGNTVEGGILNGQGGGLMVYATLSLVNTTVTGNRVANTGTNEGGGVVASGSPATLTNTTITANTIAPVGMMADAFGAGLSGNNLANVSGETNVPTTPLSVTARNTVIAGNTVDGAKEDCALITVASEVANVSSDTSCLFTGASSRQNQDVGFQALGNNGGPVDTRLLARTSPVIDLGTTTNCPATDARGLPRPSGASCDVGATEAQAPTVTGGTPSDVTTTTARISGTAGNPSPTSAGEVVVEYGPTTAYGATTAPVALPAGANGQAVAAALSGLQPGTTYHFRLVASNGEAITRGPDGTTTTAAAPAGTPAPGTTPTSPRPQTRTRLPGIVTRGSTGPNRCVSRRYTLKLRIKRGTSAVRRVRVSLDGRRIRETTKTTVTYRISARRLKAGRHTLRISVTDRAGRTRTVTRRFTRCG